MKRNENLVPLSREHHFGLLFCWKIKQGIAKGVDREIMRSYALYFWQQHLQDHFVKEEEILKDLLSPNDVLLQQMEEEHGQIYSIVDELKAGPVHTTKPLASMQALLNAHIRFEERELFPHLENLMNEVQLEKIGAHLAEHAAVPEDNFQPAFWSYN